MDYLKTIKVREKLKKVETHGTQDGIVYKIPSESQMFQLIPGLKTGMQNYDDFVFYMRLANSAPMLAQNLIRVRDIMDLILQHAATVGKDGNSDPGLKLFATVQKLCDTSIDAIANGPEQAVKNFHQDS